MPKYRVIYSYESSARSKTIDSENEQTARREFARILGWWPGVEFISIQEIKQPRQQARLKEGSRRHRGTSS